ncbi:MAG: AMP-binding protein [Nocardioides sp.]|nr:AMP-binding protein [Nocardioides sp.]
MTTLAFPPAGTPGLDPDLFLLGGRPDDVALVSPEGSLTYGELGAAVADAARELGPRRRVVLLEAANDLRTVIGYLAALAGRHPVLLVPAGARAQQDELVARYADAAEPDLHDDLALLLSTSGSTGSPKLVRLSRANLLANARSIADYLRIRPDDRALTSLPLHYCYGLSVLNSHLVSGATVVLTDLSVATECFWDLATRERATSFAGVPYTFDLLDASGFEHRELPHLRFVTQAGGRMDPATVRRYTELGRRRGWDLFVMYGQTEATARMAYLPPDLAAARPDAVGVPVPGGSFALAPVPGLDQRPGEAEVGELVYRGPNVMMGYAESVADLARGPEVTELRTGDLARQAPDGLWEITGRLNRHAKVFGLRLDLERLEQQLRDRGDTTRLVAVGDCLHAFVDRPRRATVVRQRLAGLSSLPAGAVRVHTLAEIPLTGTGKCDYAALTRQAEAGADLAAQTECAGASVESLRDLFAVALGRPDATPSDSFVSLGGDSLSFVEVSTHLGRRLGHLPPQWPSLSIEELAGQRPRRRRFTVPVDAAVVLRAVALLMILVSHTDVWLVLGGAHILLAVAGYNLARFTLATPDPAQRTRRVLAALAGVAVPASLWIAGVALVSGTYRPATAVFLNGVLGDDTWTTDWHFWFLEALVWSYLGVAALLAVPFVHRWHRRHPFAAALTVTLAALTARFVLVGVEAESTQKYAVGVVLWVPALGWAAAEARGHRQRLMVAATAVLGLAGFFADGQRELLVLAAVLLLLWARPIPVPSGLAPALRVVAGASLWVYLTHWQVYPGLEAAGHPVLAIVASLAVGVVAATAYDALAARARWLLAALSLDPPMGGVASVTRRV